MSIFKGSGVAIVTPMKDNGEIDLEVFGELIEDQIAHHTDAIIAIGTTGGFISALDDITFAPGSPITWNATINMSAWTMILDDGQVTSV